MPFSVRNLWVPPEEIISNPSPERPRAKVSIFVLSDTESNAIFCFGDIPFSG
jgi:hypothetical protein